VALLTGGAACATAAAQTSAHARSASSPAAQTSAHSPTTRTTRPTRTTRRTRRTRTTRTTRITRRTRTTRPTGSARTSSTAGTHLQVTEVEYRLLLSRGVVKAGPVSLEALDGGMDPHDLRLRHGRSSAVITTAQLAPGQRLDAVVNLVPGVYHLWCSLPEHWKLGMRATLRVVR
jgi:hypothetical protein